MLYEKRNFDFYKVPYLALAIFLAVTITLQNLFLYVDTFINSIYVSYIILLCFRYKMKPLKFIKNKINIRKVFTLLYVLEVVLYTLISILLYMDSSKYTVTVAKFNLENDNLIVYSECRTQEDYILCLGFEEDKGVISTYNKDTGLIEQLKEN